MIQVQEPPRCPIAAGLFPHNPTDVRTVFVLRAVAGFTAAETGGLLVEQGGMKAAGWNVELVRAVFRQGLCSLGSQVLQAGKS